jgi:hypothetical protein
MLVGVPLAGGISAVVVGGATGVALLDEARDRLAAIQPSDTLEDLAFAVADALAATGLVAAGLDSRAVRVIPQSDGYYRCLLEGASDADARLFAEALEQLVEPLWDPRWIIARRVEAAPSTLGGTVLLLASRALPGARGTRVWHAVPTVLARRKDRVAAFEAAWSRWVSRGAHALPVDDPRAQAILALRLGDDPFRVETQLRELWS